MRVLVLTCYGVDIPTAAVDFSLIATFDNNYRLSRKYTRRVMLGYQAWELFKADLTRIWRLEGLDGAELCGGIGARGNHDDRDWSYWGYWGYWGV